MRISPGRTNGTGSDRSADNRRRTNEDLATALASALKRFDLEPPGLPLVQLATPSIDLTVAPAVPVPVISLDLGWRIPRFLQNLMTAMSSGSTAETDKSRSSTERVSLADRRARKQAGASGKPSGDDQAADPEELRQLVEEHGDAIYRLALSVVRDKSLAEDIAQETLIKAWLALPTFRGDSSLRGWVLRITHNTAISTIRRRRAVVIDPHDMPETPIKVERSVESRVQGGVVMDDFVEALDLLDDLSRSIVVLRELEGLSYEEIGDVLDVPLPTVKTRLLRARRKLGAALREWE